MAHDVYLCYDEKDLDAALKVCETLEGSGLKCWMKNRDVFGDSRGKAIVKAIQKSKLFLLIHSENVKGSNVIFNEATEAFDANRSFLVYKIGDSKFEGDLEFLIKNRPSINAYPNPDEKSDTLIQYAKNLVKKQKWQDMKKPLAIGIIALVVIIAAVGFIMISGDDGGSSEPINVGDFEVKITDFDRKDVRKQNMDWNYSYSVIGTISPVPDASHKNMKIVVDFYDKTGSLVDSTETPFEDAQISGSGYLFGSMGYKNKDISYVEVQLINNEDVIISQDDAQI